MKSIYALLYILFISSLSFSEDNPAKVSLTGKITDKETGETIVGATIYVPDLKTGTITDTSGCFKIDNLPAVNVVIEVSYVGYKTIIQKINLASVSKMDLKLEQSIAELNAVVVTGSSKAVELRRSPVPIVALNHNNIEQLPGTNIIDAIATTPGISAVTTGPNVSKPFIHGLGYNRVLTLYDGVRQEGQQWGDEHGIEVDDNDVDRIEVMKGPASLIYGSDAIAGVVNLLPAPPVPNGTIKGNVSGNFQTNNNLIGGSLVLGRQ